jgi:hypothetical protein
VPTSSSAIRGRVAAFLPARSRKPDAWVVPRSISGDGKKYNGHRASACRPRTSLTTPHICTRLSNTTPLRIGYSPPRCFGRTQKISSGGQRTSRIWRACLGINGSGASLQTTSGPSSSGGIACGPPFLCGARRCQVYGPSLLGAPTEVGGMSDETHPVVIVWMITTGVFACEPRFRCSEPVSGRGGAPARFEGRVYGVRLRPGQAAWSSGVRWPAGSRCRVVRSCVFGWGGVWVARRSRLRGCLPR